MLPVHFDTDDAMAVAYIQLTFANIKFTSESNIKIAFAKVQ